MEPTPPPSPAVDSQHPPLFRSGIKGFEMLMPYRIREVLLVSNLYDAFILEEDGQILEPILSDYTDLNLRYVPRVRRASTGLEAMDLLAGHDRYDMILVTPHLGDLDPVAFAEEVKSRHGAIPLVLLGYDAADLRKVLSGRHESPFDYVLLWTGDSRILVAVMQLIEDRVNLLHDSARVGVQAVLLVEDSMSFLSSYLPMLYTEILEQSQRVISEGVNLSHKLLRLRARPKVLLARDYGSAMRLFEEFKEHLLGVISDVAVPRRRGGEVDPFAGLDLVRHMREEREVLPVLIQSSDPHHAVRAEELDVTFVEKHSPRLHQKLRDFMLERFGFGPFTFRRPNRSVIEKAETIQELEEAARRVEADSLLYHARRNDFSTWLRARTEFALADQLAQKSVEDFPDAETLRRFLVQSLHESRRDALQGTIADFNPRTFDSTVTFSRIGHGSLGGKARGLAFINYLLRYYEPGRSFPGVKIFVPPAVVLTTEVFDQFMEENNLVATNPEGLTAEELEERFLAADLSKAVMRDLKAICKAFRGPLSVRSSSLLEDSHLQPFAGIYETRFLTNEGRENRRLRELERAIKLVYASTWSARARAFIRATPFLPEEEKMGVVIQQLFGRRRGRRFYPTFSGVARSHNFYPYGPVRTEDGVASVGLGLGKLVVEGEGGLRFSPRHPQSLPHFSSVEDVLENAQRHFYALALREPGRDGDPAPEQPRRFPIQAAEEDGSLAPIGSTYSPENHTVTDGVSRAGHPLVTFAGVLKHGLFPLGEVLDALLQMGTWGMGSPVEIEFAVDLETGPGQPTELAFLQMRPMVVSREKVAVDLEELDPEAVLCSSDRALGNGRIEGIRDVVFVDPGEFERSRSHETAALIGELNALLRREERPYLLVGPGRWGSGDSRLGIPVGWTDISGARVVLETGFEDLTVTPSEGSHFFNNMTSFNVGYLTVNPQHGQGSLDLEWLRAQEPRVRRENGVAWLQFGRPLTVLLDGTTARGVVLKPA